MLLSFRLQKYYIFSIYASPFAKKRPKAGCFSADSVSTIRQRTRFISCASRSSQFSSVLARMRRDVAGHLCSSRPRQRAGDISTQKAVKQLLRSYALCYFTAKLTLLGLPDYWCTFLYIRIVSNLGGSILINPHFS